MNKIYISALLLAVLSLSYVFASSAEQNIEESDEKVKLSTEQKDLVKSESEDLQAIIEEYKKFVSTVSPEIREEIVEYRKNIAQINQQKKSLWLKLSNGSKDYLKEVQKFRKRVPIKNRSEIK